METGTRGSNPIDLCQCTCGEPSRTAPYLSWADARPALARTRAQPKLLREHGALGTASEATPPDRLCRCRWRDLRENREGGGPLFANGSQGCLFANATLAKVVQEATPARWTIAMM